MENLTLVGTIIAGISIIYNILTKLKNSGLKKDLLELEDLFADSRIKNENLNLENVNLKKSLKLSLIRNKELSERIEYDGREDSSKTVEVEKQIKKTKTKKSK